MVFGLLFLLKLCLRPPLTRHLITLMDCSLVSGGTVPTRRLKKPTWPGVVVVVGAGKWRRDTKYFSARDKKRVKY